MDFGGANWDLPGVHGLSNLGALQGLAVDIGRFRVQG